MKCATVRYEQYIVNEDIAILETRHYHKELGLSYTNFVFIEFEYIHSFIEKNSHSETLKTKRNIYPIEQPPDKYYLEFSQLSELLTESQINSLLIDLLKKAKDFYEVNFIFRLIHNRSSFSDKEINWIIAYSLEELKVRKSFTAQASMLKFIDIHKYKLERGVFIKALKEFPHSHQGGIYIN